MAPSARKFVLSPSDRSRPRTFWSVLLCWEVCRLGIKTQSALLPNAVSAMKTIQEIVAKMRFFSLLPVAAISVALVGPANAADDSVKEKAALCASCHGEAGVSETENTPSLAGQPDLFLQWQLIFFRSGALINEVMHPIAEQLINEYIRNLGAYFASLPPSAKAKPDKSSQMETGAKIAAGRGCASCHHQTFGGTEGVARIAWQRQGYLVKALHEYKSGVRSGGRGAGMAYVGYSLTYHDMQA